MPMMILTIILITMIMIIIILIYGNHINFITLKFLPINKFQTNEKCFNIFRIDYRSRY